MFVRLFCLFPCFLGFLSEGLVILGALTILSQWMSMNVVFRSSVLFRRQGEGPRQVLSYKRIFGPGAMQLGLRDQSSEPPSEIYAETKNFFLVPEKTNSFWYFWINARANFVFFPLA